MDKLIYTDHIKVVNNEILNFENLIFFSSQKIEFGNISLKFPKKATEDKGKQIQKINYEHIIRTISELIKKYGLNAEN